MGDSFNCPHCQGLIQTVGADLGVDATGAPAGQEFTPQSTAGWPRKRGPWRRAYIIPKGAPLLDGSISEKHIVMPAYYLGDGSDSDAWAARYPHVPCEGFGPTRP